MKKILNEFLEKHGALLISSRANVVYLTGYTNFSENERECFLLITKNKRYLITDKRYSEAVKEIVKDFEIIDTGAVSFLLKDGKEFFKKTKIKTVGFEDYDLSVAEYSKLRKFVKTKPADLRDLRIIKEKNETENIKKACKIGDEAFNYILSHIKLGVSEIEILDKLETFINSKGADISFKPIIAFGKNSSIPHHMSGLAKLKTNQIVLLDFGIKVNNYCSDMTRTVFFGNADSKFKQIYQTVLVAQTKSIEFINSQLLAHRSLGGGGSIVNGQLLAREIDNIARKHIKWFCLRRKV